ncbi:Eco57I restriction-modification methylase domain-containing protein [Actinomycetospora sp. CA-084318]|uniref:Eco57I restriction-modification methylase domain-containing protein n=1 Tax=Actinomycetospora sp. CA-084318 TaxID=3239892 RepID=UPI003D953F91
MTALSISAFPSVRTVGAVLPSEALVPAAELKLPGQSATDYELPPGTTISAAVARAWEVCLNAYRAWVLEREKRPEDDAAVALTRDKWLLPLLDVLGYGRPDQLRLQRGVETPAGVGDDEPTRYPLSHHRKWPGGEDELQVGVALHLVGAGVDLDVKTAGLAKRGPQGMVQELLNRHPRYLWGLLSNGHLLRVLRDASSLARGSYVEFDLDDIFTHQRFADFRLLFLTVHASRLTPALPSVTAIDEDAEEPVEAPTLSAETCWLERWRTTAIHDGARALTALRQNVARALAVLGTGFVAHPANDALRARLASSPHGTEDLHRALLRVAYRLLVLFVVEDRGLLHPPDTPDDVRARYADYFSTAKLRRFASSRPGTSHGDLWAAHLLVTDALADDGLPALGLPGLAAWLFDRDALDALADASISNRDLLAAVAALAQIHDPVTGVRRPVDYRNLGSEELGGVYEGLLAYVPRYDPAAREFTLQEAAGSDRKKSGSYYTPSALISLVLEEALDPLIVEARAARDPEAALLDLTVLDPACGSGHFLVAAARRIGQALAEVRTNEPEPGPSAVRAAVTDVVGRCIYGVDLNALAVEITKVALWLEAFDGSRPLPFLDSHVKLGNALLGTTPALLADGIPDAAFTVLPGDDKERTAKLKKRNKAERARGENQLTLETGDADAADRIAAQARTLEAGDDGSVEAARRRADAWRRFDEYDPDLTAARFVADAWCAAFVQPKDADSGVGITHGSLRRLAADPLDIDPGVGRIVEDTARAFRFFHWHLEFPTIFAVPEDGADPATGWTGGFSCVVGNPPWETLQVEDKQFFASVDRDDIADAKTAAIRRSMIEKLPSADRPLHDAYVEFQRTSEGTNHFLREGGRFPLTATGKLNTYAVFAETFRTMTGPTGAAGLVTPTGIATDKTTSAFFADLLASKSLLAFYDFENEAKIFPTVTNKFRFAVTSMSGPDRVATRTRLAFYTRHLTDVPQRRYEIAPEEVLLLNPNTGTMPVFRSRTDADLVLKIYANQLVLVRDSPLASPWGLSFRQGLFNMATDSDLFRGPESLNSGDFDGWSYQQPDDEDVPLYEAKMLSHFDHRFSTYRDATQAQLNKGTLPRVTAEQHDDPDIESIARYWVDRSVVEKRLAGVWDRDWLLGWRDITTPSNERTFVPSVFPMSAVGHAFPLAFPSSPEHGPLLHATWSSLVFDYVSRQKLSGTHMTYSVVQQLACPPPEVFERPCSWQPDVTLAAWVVPYVLELSYTSWRLRPYAREMHDHGPPFRWHPERRTLLRADLDAAFMHVYGLSRVETEHVLDSFFVVRKYEHRDLGEFRTRRLILDAYDRMAAAISRGGVGWTSLADTPAGLGPRHPPRQEPL